MKTAEKKKRFIILRAEGHSFTKIAEELKISKSTCSKWERDLEEPIKKAKEDSLAELFTLYQMGREARIRKLGETLQRIDEALEQKDLTEVPAEKLLKIKLEYEDRLRADYSEPRTGPELSFTELNLTEVIKAMTQLYTRIQEGSITPEQARNELKALDGIRQTVNDSYTNFSEWVGI